MKEELERGGGGIDLMKQFPESLKVHKNISTGNNSTGEDTELDGVQPFFLSII